MLVSLPGSKVGNINLGWGTFYMIARSYMDGPRYLEGSGPKIRIADVI